MKITLVESGKNGTCRAILRVPETMTDEIFFSVMYEKNGRLLKKETAYFPNIHSCVDFFLFFVQRCLDEKINPEIIDILGLNK